MIQIDIEMPKVCGLCPCFHAEHPMYCQAVKVDKNKKIVAPYGKSRPEWCPLKEQEAVEPKWFIDTHHPAGAFRCGSCGERILENNIDFYCSKCGRPVKWEGRWVK